jgi:hypothetical protein
LVAAQEAAAKEAADKIAVAQRLMDEAKSAQRAAEEAATKAAGEIRRRNALR